MDKYFIDNSHVEHRCCWNAAICIDTMDNCGPQGVRGVNVVAECREEHTQIICDALNAEEGFKQGNREMEQKINELKAALSHDRDSLEKVYRRAKEQADAEHRIDVAQQQKLIDLLQHQLTEQTKNLKAEKRKRLQPKINNPMWPNGKKRHATAREVFSLDWD